MVDVSDEDEVDTPFLNLGDPLSDQDRLEVCEASQLAFLLDELHELAVNLERTHSAFFSHRLGEPKGEISAACPDVGHRLPRPKPQSLHDLIRSALRTRGLPVEHPRFVVHSHRLRGLRNTLPESFRQE